MSEPLRVLQVLTNLNRGGMETMTMNFYRHMDRSRVQFDFLLHREEEGDYEAEARSLGARIYRVPRQNPLSPSYWRALKRFFERHPCRVVHAQLDCMSALPLSAAKREGVPVRIAHSHSSRQDRDIKYPLKMVCKRGIKRVATDLFACGEEAGRWMFGTDDFRVVRNAIDVDAYAYDPTRRGRVRAELGISADSPVIGHVGRFDPVKNQAFLADAFAALLSKRLNAKLLLIGDGQTRPGVEAHAASLGIQNGTRFLGLRGDVPDLMQAMDAFCMPSLYEGLPLVLVEAQAAGLPCLISDVIPSDCDLEGGNISRISLGCGTEAWANELDGLLGVSHDRSRGAAVVCAAGFDVAVEAARLQEFYLTGTWPERGGLQ